MYYVGGAVVALVVALIFEDSRDYLTEAFEYFIGFEWLSDLWEFVTSAFEDMGEFSWYGLVFGALTTIFLYFLSDWTLAPFLAYYDATGKILWGTITYVGTFAAGYFMGKAFENSA